VKEGETVLITGRNQDAAVMESIAVAVRKAGAFPMIEYSSDTLAKRLFFDVPAKYDTQRTRGARSSPRSSTSSSRWATAPPKTCSKAPIRSAWPRAARPTPASARR
jgi:hypothetical protein